MHKVKELPKAEFKREVKRCLTGKETEAWELIYFKLYESQLTVSEQHGCSAATNREGTC
jgi:hypothetical protein